ncbi:unnamed protein product [Urochloa humidicola]
MTWKSSPRWRGAAWRQEAHRSPIVAGGLTPEAGAAARPGYGVTCSMREVIGNRR